MAAQEREGLQNRMKANIGFSVRFVMICLTVVAVGFWFSPSPYKTKMSVEPDDDIYLTYLQRGDYMIYFDYENSL